MNLVEATVAGGEVRFAGVRLPLPGASPLRAAGRIVLGIRPHDLAVATADAQPRLRARVDVVERLGTETHLVFSVDAPRVDADALRDAMDAGASSDTVLLADDDRAQFTAVIDAHHPVAAGETIELTVDPERLHAFDAATGAAVAREQPRAAAPAAA
jgi:multiple sugar transport system ATP-binding protein